MTKEDLAKTESDIKEIFALFKTFVKGQRPSLDIEKVATGETWFGQDALDRHLCDELRTFDDVKLDLFEAGAEVLHCPDSELGAGMCTLWLANGFGCDDYLCATCAYAHWCDATCGYCTGGTELPRVAPSALAPPRPRPTQAHTTRHDTARQLTAASLYVGVLLRTRSSPRAVKKQRLGLVLALGVWVF